MSHSPVRLALFHPKRLLLLAAAAALLAGLVLALQSASAQTEDPPAPKLTIGDRNADGSFTLSVENLTYAQFELFEVASRTRNGATRPGGASTFPWADSNEENNPLFSFAVVGAGNAGWEVNRQSVLRRDLGDNTATYAAMTHGTRKVPAVPFTATYPQDGDAETDRSVTFSIDLENPPRHLRDHLQRGHAEPAADPGRVGHGGAAAGRRRQTRAPRQHPAHDRPPHRPRLRRLRQLGRQHPGLRRPQPARRRSAGGRLRRKRRHGPRRRRCRRRRRRCRRRAARQQLLPRDHWPRHLLQRQQAHRPGRPQVRSQLGRQQQPARGQRHLLRPLGRRRRRLDRPRRADDQRRRRRRLRNHRHR